MISDTSQLNTGGLAGGAGHSAADGRDDERAGPVSVVWALGFLVFANIFDMGGVFGLKYASYLLCVAAMALHWNRLVVHRHHFLIAVALFFVWPLVCVLRGLAGSAEMRDAAQQLTPFLPALLALPLVPLVRPRFLLDTVMNTLALLGLVVGALFALFLILPKSGPAQAILTVLQIEGNGYFGTRTLGPITIPNVYFKATLYLVPAFTWFLYRQQYRKAWLCLIALALAFSRSGVLICVLVMFLYTFIAAPWRGRVILIAVVAALVTIVWQYADLLQIGAILDMYLDVLAGRGDSASERSGHFQSILALLSNDSLVFWFGQGAGVMFYSSGVNAYVATIELDHLDAIRQFGFTWFMGFSAVVAYVSGLGRHLAHSDMRGARAAVVSAFFAAGTNPVLINPLFSILLVASYRYLIASDESREAGSARG